MAIKQRALMKLDMTKKHILRVIRTRSKAALGEVYRDLTEARDLYREGLPRSSYAAYGEIYDGLILAVQKIMEGEEANFQEDVLVLCQELLEHLERETAKETRFKKEIFFLPYKLSMFDSLESVWKAADEDKEHCIAYVMPIPYADRNPDQTVAAWHCERDQFPKEVPTLDWQQVDLKAWHPDIIVYHSPYDNCNAVTSVDEQYYSRNLQCCADKLVYIPYAVEEEVQPGNRAAEDAIMHRVLCPGIMNADLVVAQSENTRQAWINILTRHTNVNDRAYWEKRVLGLGSPKIDKVLTSKREDFDMPEKWKKLIEGKMVILYITSISPALQYSDKVCDKLRYVFEVFRNRDDVVLWWRPHPLMKATFHAMIPQFEEDYLSLEKQYIEEGWGIYDDSSDLHRAICWSNGYYGDYSSVMVLYRATGKLSMIQTLGFEHDYLRLRLSAIFVDDNFIYLTSNSHRGAFICKLKRNCEDVSIQFLQDESGDNLHTSILSGAAVGSQLFLFPYHGKNIDKFIMYNLSMNSYDTLDIKEFNHRSYEPNYKQAFRFPVTYSDKIYVGTWNWPIVASVDLIQRKVKLLKVENEDLIEDQLQMFGFGGLHTSCLASGHIYIMYYDHNSILDVDAETETILGFRQIGDRSLRFRLMTTDGNYIWLGSLDGRIVRWNPSDNLLHIYTERMPLYEGNNPFCNGYMFYQDGYLHMFCSSEAKNPMCIYTRFDVATEMFSDIELRDRVGRLNNMIATNEGQYLLSSRYQGCDKVFLLDSLFSSRQSWNEWKVSLSDFTKSKIKERILNDYIAENGEERLSEGESEINLLDFIEAVCHYKKNETQNIYNGCSFNRIMEEILL